MITELEKIHGKCNLPNCNYVRMVSKSVHWGEKTIEHPIYGRVTNRMAANYDLDYHDCTAHRVAVEKMTALRRDRGEKLAPYRIRKGTK